MKRATGLVTAVRTLLGPSASHSDRSREPALDGLRALCVIAVLLYHQPVSWLPGGFLGVSTFFTISGFLITRILLAEVSATGTIRLGRFTARRLRRLTPAAVTVALLSVVMWAVTGRDLPRGDVPAAIGYVSNWWLVHVGHGYSQLFGVASPVQHYWSLAIEEQFYLVFPLVTLGLMRLCGRRPGRFAVGLGFLTVASFALAAALPADTAYYATPARIGEILVGSLLAVAASRPASLLRIFLLLESRIGALLAPLAVVTLGLLWTRTELGDPWLFPWATGLNALASAVLVAEAMYGRTVRQVLRRPSLASTGRVSYSLYLVHWPVYLLLTPSTPMSDTTVLFCRLSVSAAVAAAIYAVVEEPIRTGRRLQRHLLPIALGGLATATIVLAVAAVGTPRSAAVDEQAIAEERAALLTFEPAASAAPAVGTAITNRPASNPSTGPGAPVEAAPATTAPPAPELRRILFVGDSTSWTLSLGVTETMRDQGVEVRSFPAVGCGIGGATPIRYLNLPERTDATCQTWFDELPVVIERFRPDVVLVVGGVADLSDRRLPSGEWSHIGRPDFDTWLADRMDAMVELLSAQGATVGWTTLPHLFVLENPGFTGPAPFAENDPTRVDRYDALIRELAERDERVGLVDLAGYLEERPGGEFAEGLRPDGVHIDSRRFPDISEFLAGAGRELFGALAT